jgi:hypothetical protein
MMTALNQQHTEPSRHEIEQAFLRIRCQHGNALKAELDILWRAIFTDQPMERIKHEAHHRINSGTNSQIP